MSNLAQAGRGETSSEWSAAGASPFVTTTGTPRQPQNGGMGPLVAGVIGSLLLLMAASSLHAPVHAIKKAIGPQPNVAETSLNSYLERVSAANSNVQPVPGSIWTDSGRLARMNTVWRKANLLKETPNPKGQRPKIRRQTPSNRQ